MIGAAIADAGTTILVLPMVALRGDMLRRFHQVGIRPLIWSVDCKQSASLVFVSAEAACTQSFLEYCHIQVSKQRPARIVVDESHLTITASEYRPCMGQLGWYVRQVRTQTVWLTATLPPVMQEEFIEHNKLVKPRIVQESTNRPNIKYTVRFETGPGALVEKAAHLVQTYWPKKEIFDHSRDKIIIYCRTREEVAQLADLLQCPSYTSESGPDEEKAALLSKWIADPDQPVIVATSALGIGFDYPYVRWVVHVDTPDKATAFSQESGRAGRDGGKASSIAMLSATWKPQLDKVLSPDEGAMQLYLTQQYCSRGVLSQFLDAQPDWRWCMPGEEVCQVCQKPHTAPGDSTGSMPRPRRTRHGRGKRRSGFSGMWPIGTTTSRRTSAGSRILSTTRPNAGSLIW
jgi:superfamily II DNA helicase RecQ